MSARTAVALALALMAAAPAGAAPSRLGPAAKGPVRRVVTLAPSLSELVLALGAGDRLVGVSRFDEDPAVAKLPRVGGFTDPSVEAVLRLKPDLALVFPGPGNQRPVERMAELGVPVLLLPLHTVDDVVQAMRAVGAALGRSAEAEALVARIDDTRARVRVAARARAPQRVLLAYGFEPLVVAGPGSFADELLRDCNAVNVAADGGGAYVVYSVERALAARPDVVVDSAHVDTGKEKLVGLGSLARARWVDVPSKSLLQPGPSLAQGLEELFALLYPGVPLPPAVARPDAGVLPDGGVVPPARPAPRRRDAGVR